MDSQTVIIKPAVAKKKQLKIKEKKIVVEPEEGTPFKTQPQAELSEVVDQPTDFIAELLKKKMEEEEENDDNCLECQSYITSKEREWYETKREEYDFRGDMTTCRKCAEKYISQIEEDSAPVAKSETDSNFDIMEEKETSENDDDEIDRQIELLKKKKMEKNKWKVDEINEEIAFQEKEMNEQITRIRNEFLAFKQKKESEIEKLTGKKVSPIVTKTYWRKKTTTTVGEDGEPNWKKKYTPEQYARKVAYDKAWRERKAAGLPTKLGRVN
jgi:hypothetical protein